MFTKDFSYKLPEELIAKNPLSKRDASKLMILNKASKSIQHKVFYELPDILSSQYLLVFNNTKVFAARLIVDIDGKEGEILLLNNIIDQIWNCMVKPGKRFKLYRNIKIKGKKKNIKAEIIKINKDGTREIEFDFHGDFSNWLSDNGYPPLPPYIRDSKAELADYQTLYAEKTGSIAAPTAGLHFTNDIFKGFDEKNIDTCFVTLHVGRGTFLPVKTDTVEEHKMHTEWYEISKKCAEKLNNAKKEGKKILAIGTTSVRVLESSFEDGLFQAKSDETDIFIYPGYEFKAVDALLTNFHLPESTLIMLVSAFTGKEFVFKAYEEAIKSEYRFYSFGDAMLII